jgi:hypothetical protein
MQLRRFVGLVDLGVLTILIAAILLPPREMYGEPVGKGSDDERYSLALAEARTIAHPDDPRAVEEYVRILTHLELTDWAIESGVKGVQRTKGSELHWRALFATAVAYMQQRDRKPVIAYIERWQQACEKAGKIACPDFARTRIEKLYVEPLMTGEGKIRSTRLGGRPPAP